MQKLDMYGIPIQFSYLNKTTFATYCGCWVSVFVILIILAYIILYSIDTAKRDFSFVVTETENLELAPTYSFDRSTSPKEFSNNGSNYLHFMFGFRNRDTNQWIKESDFDSYAIKLEIEKYSLGEKEKLLYSQSENEHSEVNNSFNNFDLKNTYSIDNDTFDLGSDRLMDKNNASYIVIRVKKNRNANDDEKQNLLNVDFYYIYSNYLISEDEKNKCLIPYFDWKIYELSEKTKVIALSYFQVSKLSSYANIWPKSMGAKGKHRYFTAFDENKYTALQSTAESDENSDDNILEIYIQASDSINKYERTYSNLFELLGYFGGFAQILFIIGAILVCWPAAKTLDESIINDFYNIIDPQYNDKVDYDFGKFLKNLSEADDNMDQIKQDIRMRNSQVEAKNKKDVETDQIKNSKIANNSQRVKDEDKLGIPAEIGEGTNSKRAVQLYLLGEYFRPKAKKLYETHLKLQNPSEYNNNAQQEDNKEVDTSKKHKEVKVQFKYDAANQEQIASKPTLASNNIGRSSTISNKGKALASDILDYKAHKLLFTFYLNTIFSGLKFTVCESFCNCICCCECVKTRKLRRKNKVFNKALFSLRKDTDFVSILKSISSFEAIKQSFLRENTQYCIFKSLSRKTYAQNYEDKRGKTKVLNDLTIMKTYNKLAQLMGNLQDSSKEKETYLDMDKKIINEMLGNLRNELGDDYIEEIKKVNKIADQDKNKEDAKDKKTTTKDEVKGFNMKDLEQLNKKYGY